MKYASFALLNASVWTGRPAHGRPQAIAVDGDRIIAVGTNDEVAALCGPLTKKLDAGGRLVLPGFNDSHAHFLLGGRQLLNLDLRGARSQEEFAALIAARARRLAPESWLVGGNWDNEGWPGGRLPSKDDIDEYTPHTPVFVARLDLHMGLANSKALNLAGITAATQDPPGGTIDRCPATGQPTGLLKDAAMDLIWRVMPKPAMDDSVAAVAQASAYAASLGVTSLQDMAVWDEWTNWDVFQEYHRRHESTVRLCARMPLSYWVTDPALIEGKSADNNWLRLGGVKSFVDGSLGSLTALFFAPYDDAPDRSGLLVQPPAVLAKQIAAADRAGLQAAVHAIGDKANSILLDIYAGITAENSRRDRRLRVEHAQHLVAGDISRLAALRVIASVQPYHAIDDGRWAEKRVGADRAKLAYPFRSLLDAGVTLAFGTDWPVAPLNPLLGIHAAVTRATGDPRHPDGWQPQERISVEEAVRAYTVASAYAEFADNDKGTLEPGKLADFVVLSRDIFAMPAPEIAAVEVLCTICGGRVVFEK